MKKTILKWLFGWSLSVESEHNVEQMVQEYTIFVFGIKLTTVTVSDMIILNMPYLPDINFHINFR